MKKHYLLSALLIFACSSDDSSNDDSIEGIWYLVSSTVDGEIQELDSCELESYLDISMDSLSENISLNNAPEANLEFDGTSMLYWYTCENPSYNGRYLIKSTTNPNMYDFWFETLTLTQDGTIGAVGLPNVAEVNGNTLILSAMDTPFSEELSETILIFEKN
ncbi:MAG: hypothetical protein ACJ0P6_01505 [Flavobacteriaceae bacterium]|tara:strand:- start:6330 stop:6815 length:486 start_codon:yes stop_codon:yes gene_type:complete